jgi:uracil-DNA glycosylase family 4
MSMAHILRPDGPTTAKIAFVGEAPGGQEERLGRPFVGPSGQLLDECLSQVGIRRKDCYLTNVVKERPANNDIRSFIDLSKNKPKITEEGQRYIDSFLLEMKGISANVIVPLGNVPLWCLTGSKNITKRHGSILRANDGRKIIPSIHPAAALREYLFKYYIQADLRRIRREAEFPDIRLTNYHLNVGPTFSEVFEFLNNILIDNLIEGAKQITVDIEVLNYEISCISIGTDQLTMSIPFTNEQGDYFTPEQEVQVWKFLTEILERPTILKLGQNLSFDATFLHTKYGIRVSPMADTMVAAGILYPELPKGLDFLTTTYTDMPYYKDDGKQWFKLGGTFKDLWVYNAKDSAVLPTIFKKQTEQLRKQGNLQAYLNQVSLIEPIVYMSSRGIRTDYSGILKAKDEADIQLSKLYEEFHKECGYECNPKSPAQLKQLFYVQRNHRPYTSRSSGQVTTDRDALKRLSRKGDKAAKILLEIRQLGKLRDTYYNVLLDADKRLRCNFNPVGTTSGRLSSSKTIFKTGLNLQNLPDKYRRFLLIDDGYIGYQLDLSQAENRVVAYIAPDPLMIEAFEKGIDVHRLTASLIFGKRIEEISDEPGSTSIGGGIYSERFWGKKANHGLNYDLGYKTFAFYYEIPESDSRYIVERYHQAYPGVRRYHAWVRQDLSTRRTLEDCLGKRRIFLDRWGDQLFKEAYSYIPQSTVAGKLNHDGMLELHRGRNDRYKHVELLNQVHDSVWIQIPISVPLEKHIKILSQLKRSLEHPIHWKATSFSIPADIEVTFGNFGKFHEQENLDGLRKFKFNTQAEGLAKLAALVEEDNNARRPGTH